MQFLLALLLPVVTLADPAKHPVDFSVTGVKVDVDVTNLPGALAALGLAESGASPMAVYFYDTAALDLYRSHILLRSRESSDGGKVDFTIKARPIDPARVTGRWKSVDGFKCDYDATKLATTPQCLVKQKLAADQVEQIAGGRVALRDALGADQQDFAQEFGPGAVDWSAVKPLGPVQSLSWNLGADGAISAELWTLQGHNFLELSEKVNAGQEAATRASLLALLSGKGLAESEDAQFKTDFVMHLLDGHAR